MITLPNGLTVFNATPHAITLWREDWSEPINVPTDAVINATPTEVVVKEENGVLFVKTVFVANADGREVLSDALWEAERQQINMVVIGSIIAAQAYPGDVVAMTPAPGYERVSPADKRMNPDKFTVF